MLTRWQCGYYDCEGGFWGRDGGVWIDWEFDNGGTKRRWYCDWDCATWSAEQQVSASILISLADLTDRAV
jgi:hypothetical protein